MKHFNFIKPAEGDTRSLAALAERWKTPQFRSLEESVRTAIVQGKDIPVDAPTIEVECDGAKIRLVDLRGINLSRIEIGKVDLTYCCFDGADFQGSKFNGTLVQYSSFVDASLDDVEWNSVQASPISAAGVSFCSARIRNSFLMRSSLLGVRFDDAEIESTALVGSMLGDANLVKAKRLFDVDISQVYLRSKKEVSALLRKDGLRGFPAVLEESKKVSVPKHKSLRLAKIIRNIRLVSDEWNRLVKSENYGVTYHASSVVVAAGGAGKKNAERFYVGKVVAENITAVTVALNKGAKSAIRNYKTQSDVVVSVGDIVQIVETRKAKPERVARGYRGLSKRATLPPVKVKEKELVITRVLKSHRLTDDDLAEMLEIRH